MFSGGIVRLHPTMDRYYLFSFLKHPLFRTQLLAMSPRGATITHVPSHRLWLPVLRPYPSSKRAAAITPAERGRCSRTSLLLDRRLSFPEIRKSRLSGIDHISRPARRLLSLQARECSLNRPRRPFDVGALPADVVTSFVRSDCYRLERQLPGGIRTRFGMPPFTAHRIIRVKALFPEHRRLCHQSEAGQVAHGT